jgi:hypothetical protein
MTPSVAEEDAGIADDPDRQLLNTSDVHGAP